MSKIEVQKIDAKSIGRSEIMEMGYNMLADADLKIIDRKTGETPIMKVYVAENDQPKKAIATNVNITSHIDVFADSADFIFDLKKEQKIEKIFISSFYKPDTDYIMRDFAVFGANSEEALFNEENKLFCPDMNEEWKPGDERNCADWLYKAEGSLRFFGVRVYKANVTDDIIRPENMGVFSEAYTEKKNAVKVFIGESLIKGMEPRNLTSGSCLEDCEANYVMGKMTYSFSTDAPTVDKVFVITKGEAEITVRETLLHESFRKFGCIFYEGEPNISGGDFEVVIKGDVLVYDIAAASGKRSAKVNFNEVINEDYLGIGANVLPMSFMPESLESGYNEAYWELEKRRIMLVRPNVVRLWFQPDWIFETKEEYTSGQFNFDTDKMQSVYKYLDAFKSAGTEVEFNFGWKVSTNIQEWFSFPNLPKPSNSAPKELEPFARCCGEVLYELINNRNYDNIKYLTFYNEPAYEDGAAVGDFVVICEGRKEYWDKMATLCREAIDKKGLGHIKIWGAEEAGSDETQSDWMRYFDDKDVLDMHTSHRYRTDSASNHKNYFKFIKECCKNKPVMITECGQCYSSFEYSWDMSHVQHFCDFTNAGISGGLIWCLNSAVITDPCSFTMRNGIDMWDIPQAEGGIDNVREVFYEWAMLCRYVPKHSKSVKTEVLTDGIRTAAIKTDSGDYTVVVELNASNINRNLEIKLDMPINKKMYRHIYKRPSVRNGNALLPPVSKEIFVENTITDELSGDYMEIVYTTIPPVHQIILPKTEVFLAPGEKFTLSASNIDGFGEIAWEKAANIGDSFEFALKGFEIIAKEDAKAGDMCALKAYSVQNPEAYAIMIVKIK